MKFVESKNSLTNTATIDVKYMKNLEIHGANNLSEASLEGYIFNSKKVQQYLKTLKNQLHYPKKSLSN